MNTKSECNDFVVGKLSKINLLQKCKELGHHAEKTKKTQKNFTIYQN